LATLLLDLRAGGRLTELELGPLDAADTAELAIRVAGRMLDADETRRLFEETEGQPLFVVETVRGLMGSSSHATVPLAHARTAHGGRPLPPKVYAVIAARLAQLSDATRDIVRLAATIGRSFTLELLATASTRDMDSVVAAIDELWERRQIREQSASVFDFSHDRIREVAYTDMSAARRGLLHRRVAQALEGAAGRTGEDVSAELAAHYEQAGLLAEAVPHYRRAAELAQRVHAHHEAIRLLGRGIDLLCALPAGQERDQQELAMQISLGTSHVETVGYGAVAALAPYRRAEELSVGLGQPPSPPVLRGLAVASITRAEFDKAQEFGNTLLRLAADRDDALLLVEGHYVVGVSQFWKGELVLAREHLEQALSYYPAGGARDHVSLYAQDPRVVCSSRLAVDLWLLGYPDDARKIMTNALRHAQQLSHPYSLCYALTWSVILAMLESNLELAQERNDASATVTREHRMDTFVGAQGVARGWLLAERGDALGGIRLMQEGIAAHRAASIAHQQPWFTGLVAERYGKIGRPEEGLRLVSDALDAVERTDERWSEAELHRVQGTLLQVHGESVDAERAFQHALCVARQQHARAFELRTLSSLNARQELRPAR
jgi:tetratricopeptide (TPR) repeat protein